MHLNILIMIKTAKPHTQRTLFACYNALNLTESDLKRAYSLLAEHFFFTGKINISQIWFFMKIVCL